MVEPLWRCLVQLMHMEMVAVIWPLGDDFDGAVEMPDDDHMMVMIALMMALMP